MTITKIKPSSTVRQYRKAYKLYQKRVIDKARLLEILEELSK